MCQHTLQRFLRTEDGAVTVDWVVICAAIVFFAVFVTTLVGSNAVLSVNASATRMQDTPTFGQ